jgi:hypothetical protein
MRGSLAELVLPKEELSAVAFAQNERVIPALLR